MHEEDVIRVAVSSRVECELLVRENFCAEEIQVIHDFRHRALVTEDRVTTEDHRVTLLHADVLMHSEAHA